MNSDGASNWLMEGDPAIRWQTMRDLLGAPEAEWQSERAKFAEEGWGKRFLECQDPAGTWGSGIYGPKWKSTTYTLLTLIDCGIDNEHPAAKRGAVLILEQGITKHLRQGHFGRPRRERHLRLGLLSTHCRVFWVSRPNPRRTVPAAAGGPDAGRRMELPAEARAEDASQLDSHDV